MCENKKIDSANWGILNSGTAHPHLPTLFIRFNPHEFDKRRLSLDERCCLLVQEVQRNLTSDIKEWDPLRANVIFMFYHSKGAKHIDSAKSRSESINVLKVVE